MTDLQEIWESIVAAKGHKVESYLEACWQAAHRAGWEQAKREAAEIALHEDDDWIYSSIVAMEYKGE